MPDVPPLSDLTPTSDHLAQIDALRAQIGWGPGSWFLGPMMEAGGRILGIRDPAGELVAMGGAAAFAPGGFICNMVVRPDHKRHGFGRRVFEELIAWLDGSGYRTIQLEATEEGRPLYEQYGFTALWESVAGALVSPPARGDETGLSEATEDDWPAVAELDRLATGMDRGGLLMRLTGQPNYRGCLVKRDGGGISGYGLRFDNRIGPLMARSAETAEQLARALAARSAVGTLATVGHPQHRALWEQLGFEVTAFDVRMIRGEPAQGDPSMVYCMLNGGAG